MAMAVLLRAVTMMPTWHVRRAVELTDDIRPPFQAVVRTERTALGVSGASARRIDSPCAYMTAGTDLLDIALDKAAACHFSALAAAERP